MRVRHDSRRTVQGLLGRKDVRTAMIYAHVFQPRWQRRSQPCQRSRSPARLIAIEKLPNAPKDA